MKCTILIAFVLQLVAASPVHGKKQEHEWLVGKILDENRARYFAGMLNNSSSQSTVNGSWSGSANSTSIGDTTTTQASGDYSGTRNTSTSGTSVAMYRVYDNLVIEGEDTVYVTSEQLRWRWSKGAHVAVNGTIKYYVDGRKLHVLDDDSKEHTIEIVKEIRKAPAPAQPPPVAQTENSPPPTNQLQAPPAPQAALAIESTPAGADIEVDGAFVGNTPSTVDISSGLHQISVKKKGFADWTRKLNVTGGDVHLNAELDPATTPTEMTTPAQPAATEPPAQ